MNIPFMILLSEIVKIYRVLERIEEESMLPYGPRSTGDWDVLMCKELIMFAKKLTFHQISLRSENIPSGSSGLV